ADPDLLDLRGDRARVGHSVALEVAVVEPDRLEAGRAGALGPGDRIGNLATRGEPETDAARKRHQSRPPASSSCAFSIRFSAFSFPSTSSDSERGGPTFRPCIG